MPSQIKVDQIAGATGSTVTLPSGQTLDLSSGTVTLPSAGITADKLNLISTASVPSITAKGTVGVTDGYIQLNCEQNSHGIKIKSPPHSAGANYTLVMPSATGTATQVLRMNSGATALEFGTISSGANAGEVIQVVSTDYTGTASSTSATPADVSGFSAIITPASASNKILVFVSVAFGGAVDSYPYVLLKRNGTSISVGVTATGAQINTFLTGAITSVGGSDNTIKQHSKSFLDSPSSTSAVTYQIQLASPYAGNTGYINRAHTVPNTVYVQFPTSTITLMEIKQ